MSPPIVPEFMASDFGRFGMQIEVITHPNLPNGQCYLYGQRYLWIGTAPETEHQKFMRSIRMIVRRGMADVLEWLGEPVEIDVCHPRGEDLVEMIRRGIWTHDTARMAANEHRLPNDAPRVLR